jgi:hypothetical protein
LRPYDTIVGPETAVRRMAFWHALYGFDFDVDRFIAEYADYLNQEKNAQDRARLVFWCEEIIRRTDRMPVWILPEVEFKPAEWATLM